MSSSEYSSFLKPDPWLRIIVIICGQLLLAAGVVVILTMSLDVVLRAVGCAACLGYGHLELKRLQRGFDDCLEIRLSAGPAVLIRDSNQQWVAATLESGSVLLRRFAWLRFRSADGRRFSELLTGDARESHDWRHLQVIWRHVGAP